MSPSRIRFRKGKFQSSSGTRKTHGLPPNDGSFNEAIGELAVLKNRTRVAACIPARNESATIGKVVRVCRALQEQRLLDEIVVVDDQSDDMTAAVAVEAGASVVTSDIGPGKGQALQCGVENTRADLLIFLDADVMNVSPSYVCRLVYPLLINPEVQLVKAAYTRSLYGLPNEGGRVTELVARPMLELFFPELADVAQPLAGEMGVRRSVFSDVNFSPGYGVEIGLLIDVYKRFGRNAVVDANLGEKVHRNRPLFELRGQAKDVLEAVFVRALPELDIVVPNMRNN